MSSGILYIRRIWMHEYVEVGAGGGGPNDQEEHFVFFNQWPFACRFDGTKQDPRSLCRQMHGHPPGRLSGS